MQKCAEHPIVPNPNLVYTGLWSRPRPGLLVGFALRTVVGMFVQSVILPHHPMSTPTAAGGGLAFALITHSSLPAINAYRESINPVQVGRRTAISAKHNRKVGRYARKEISLVK
jgi:hypothetical protein